MFLVDSTKQYDKDYQVCKKRGCDTNKLELVINYICCEENKKLVESHKEHKLRKSRLYSDNVRECHVLSITSDWILVYKIYKQENLCVLIRTGTYSDIF